MSPAEIDQAYRQIVKSLRELDYRWIVAQVEETLSLGRVRSGRAIDYSTETETDGGSAELQEDVPLRVLREHTYSEATEANQAKRSRRGRSVEIQKIQPFSPSERLRILLTAVERAFVAVPDMEKSTSAVLQRISPTLESIV
jgi:hypothetical protein